MSLKGKGESKNSGNHSILSKNLRDKFLPDSVGSYILKT